MTKLRIRRILAAVDLGPQSEDVLTWTRWFATRFGAKVEVAHAIPLSLPPYFTEGQVKELVKELDHARAGIGKHVERLANRILLDVPFRVIVREGHALEVIRAVAHEVQPDLIVIGSHGHGPLQRLLLGSVAEHLFREAPCPTLVVKSKLPEAGVQGILCPVNFSELARECADCSKVLAEQAGADVFLLQALEGAGVDVDHSRARLCQWQAEGGTTRARVTELVGRGNPVEETIAAAQRHPVDLIVVGARHRRLLDALVLGRTTEYVVRLSPVSVLVLPEVVEATKHRLEAQSAAVSS